MGAFLDWTTTQLQTGTECSCCNGLNILSTDLVAVMWIFITFQVRQHSVLQWKRNSSDTESLSSHSQLVQTPLPRSSLWHWRLRWLPGWAVWCCKYFWHFCHILFTDPAKKLILNNFERFVLENIEIWRTIISDWVVVGGSSVHVVHFEVEVLNFDIDTFGRMQ